MFDSEFWNTDLVYYDLGNRVRNEVKIYVVLSVRLGRKRMKNKK